MQRRYDVITLCGSTKFKSEFEKVQKELTLKGNIVLSVGCFSHAGDVITDEQKIMLDDMHKRKIDMSNAIYVINVNNYIGESTKSEIEYAKEHKKKIYYLVHPLVYELSGKRVKYRRENTILTIKKVIPFEEDTFGQGNFAVITDDGQYLYECEIDVLN